MKHESIKDQFLYEIIFGNYRRDLFNLFRYLAKFFSILPTTPYNRQELIFI